MKLPADANNSCTSAALVLPKLKVIVCAVAARLFTTSPVDVPSAQNNSADPPGAAIAVVMAKVTVTLVLVLLILLVKVTGEAPPEDVIPPVARIVGAPLSTGAVVSITSAAPPAREVAPASAGKVVVTGFPFRSLMVPPLSTREFVAG